MVDSPSDNSFQDLGPDEVLNCIEIATGTRLNNLFRPLNSYINRVFELETEDGTRFIAKFYRPGRWTAKAIGEEHRFLAEMADQEIPVIPPLVLKDGNTLGNCENRFLFAVFPKCGGRSVDEFTDDQWLQIGRLLGRVHKVGEAAKANHRVVMGPHESASAQLRYLLDSQVVPRDQKAQLGETVGVILEDIAPFFQNTEKIRIHGDCHFSNFIYRPGESFYIIDFDDMAVGPPVQDIWMLLPGAPEDCFVELDLLLEGYETFRNFDRRSLRLIEPLRAMRFIHYLAWCVHQVEADGFTKVIDGFGSHEYWQNELSELVDQRQRIADNMPLTGNI